MTEKYLLFDLSDEKSKKLGEVLGNETCKKIVNLLAEKELTASEISRELKLAMNTTTYNIGNLIQAGLIEESKSFWSVKGKKMPSYKVSNKAIVISPRKTSNIYSKLKGVVPVVLIAGILTAFVAWYYKAGSYASQIFDSSNKLINNLPQATSAGAVQEAANRTIESFSYSYSSPALWFALGALVVLVAFLLWNYKKL